MARGWCRTLGAPETEGSCHRSPPGTTSARSLRITLTSPEEPTEKRARHEVGDINRGRDKETIVILQEEEKQGSETGMGETDVETRAPASEDVWAAEFRHYTGRLIHHADSASHNIETALGVLRSCILPRDAKAVSGCTKGLVREIAQSLLNVSFLVFWFFSSVECWLFVTLSFVSYRQAEAQALVINDRCKG